MTRQPALQPVPQGASGEHRLTYKGRTLVITTQPLEEGYYVATAEAWDAEGNYAGGYGVRFSDLARSPIRHQVARQIATQMLIGRIDAGSALPPFPEILDMTHGPTFSRMVAAELRRASKE